MNIVIRPRLDIFLEYLFFLKYLEIALVYLVFYYKKISLIDFSNLDPPRPDLTLVMATINTSVP